MSSLEGVNLPDGSTAADFDIVTIDISDDGQSAQGAATFVDINAVISGGDTVPTGSFEFTCPQD